MRIKNEVFVIQFIIYSVLCIRQNRVHLSLDIRASTREMSSTLTCAILGWLAHQQLSKVFTRLAINQARPSAWSSPYLPNLPLLVSSPKEYNRHTTISYVRNEISQSHLTNPSICFQPQKQNNCYLNACWEPRSSSLHEWPSLPFYQHPWSTHDYNHLPAQLYSSFNPYPFRHWLIKAWGCIQGY
jgi:hypothetical protein